MTRQNGPKTPGKAEETLDPALAEFIAALARAAVRREIRQAKAAEQEKEAAEGP